MTRHHTAHLAEGLQQHAHTGLAATRGAVNTADGQALDGGSAGRGAVELVEEPRS